ncbi:transglutaminase TgpA family protein [Sulfuriflexus mobilis]|uniref:transglutaminase TgpA family protein n=1 Tax=Sulfuriflexus mobilis TaxID=1811807 RepID=UPI000F838C34|nr:DUF3488 and transglutaminase-like domain-containing protein [Sulfuriflexus mobilis]
MSQAAKNQLAMQLGLRPRTVGLMFISLAMVILPHAGRLPVWTLAAAFIFMLWRVQHERRGWPLPGRILKTVLLLLMIIGIIASYGISSGRLTFVALLVVLLGLKFIELRTRRDLMLVLFLGYFVVITHFLDNQNISMAVYMLVVVLLLTTALISFNRRQDIRRGELKADARLALVMLLQAIPIMLVLFVLFPRLSGVLWAVPTGGGGAVTGLSDDMSPGKISSLTRSTAIAFRVEFHGERPDTSTLYWRGPVLWHYDGERWTGTDFLAGRGMQLQNTARQVEYTVTLEANNTPWLLALDLPTHLVMADSRRQPLDRSGLLADKSKLTADYQLIANEPVTSRKRYRLVSSLHYRTPEITAREWQQALQLPDDIGDKLLAFAEQLRRQHISDSGVVNAMLRHFREQPFFYTLQPRPLGNQPMQEFLFESREGFCEHYASAFTLVMRAAGIPARVVTGYQSSEVNPYGDYLVVRQSDAHAWAEVWLNDHGWLRVDPTAAVAPERIKLGLEALPEFSVAPAVLGKAGALSDAWLAMTRSWDAVNNAWYQWVLGYDHLAQKRLLERLGLSNTNSLHVALVMLIAILILLGLLALSMLRPRKQQDSVGTLYTRFCRIMEKRGLPRHDHEGPRDYSRRLQLACPELAPQISAITTAYISYRYAGSQGPDEVQRLRQAIRQLKA